MRLSRGALAAIRPRRTTSIRWPGDPHGEDPWLCVPPLQVVCPCRGPWPRRVAAMLPSMTQYAITQCRRGVAFQGKEQAVLANRNRHDNPRTESQRRQIHIPCFIPPVSPTNLPFPPACHDALILPPHCLPFPRKRCFPSSWLPVSPTFALRRPFRR